jgi:hypothetical protein
LDVASFWDCVERAVSEEVAMFVAFPAAKGNVFIIYGLGPIFIVIFQSNGAWERLGYVHVDADSCIRGIAPLLCSFRGFDINTYGVADSCEDLFQPKFLRERV